MSDSQKPPKEWRILQGRKESFIQDMTFAAPVGKEINELMVEQIDLAISKSSYDQLMQQALAMREALEEIYNDTKAEHGIHESEIKPWDSSSLGNVKGALEQFDEFMKDKS